MTTPPDAFTTPLSDRYRVEHELGAGGMATVYLAHDLRHDRQVAIKVLHEDLGATLGPERFLAEIKTTAKLQHPHILPLLDSGTAGGLLYYVMPYVEGETLRSRLTRETQLPIEDAVRIAREVADALGFAHGHGIVHRDIKPENILLQGGHALVADFGIALAVQQAGGTRLTQTGLSLGTPQYMSPEQAIGEKTVGPAADLYALGAVTYEMLTGDPPFTGSSVQAIVAKVMSSEPERLTTTRRTIPPNVEAAVLTALAKLPADRFPTAAAFALALASGSIITAAPILASKAARSPWSRLPLWGRVGAAIAGLAVIVSTGVWLLGIDSSGEDQVLRLTINPPPGTRFDVVNWAATAVTPDGGAVVFAARGKEGSQLYLRRLDDYQARLLRSTEELAPSPTISPDGRWVVVLTTGVELLKVDVTGNAPPKLLGPQQDWFGFPARWASDSILVRGFPLQIVATPAFAGAERTVARIDATKGERQFRGMVVLPDGQLVVTIETDSGLRTAFVMPTGERVWVTGLDRATVKAFMPPATLLGEQDGRYFMGTLRSGAPRVADRRDLGLDAPAGAPIAVGGQGTLAYFHLERGSGRRLVWVDRRGTSTPIPAPSAEYRAPRLSPDGRRVAVYGATADSFFVVEVIEAQTGARTRLPTPEYSTNPVWDPSGRSVTFAVGFQLPQRVLRQNADGSGTARQAFTAPFRSSPVSATSDGTVFLDALSGTYDIHAVDADGRLNLAIGGPRAQRTPAISPDGRWLAYQSNENGRFEVYVQPWPGLDHKWTVSTEGGTEPVWSRDGRELFFRRGSDMMVSRITTTTTFQAGKPDVLFNAGQFAVDPFGDLSYDVAPDGRFLMIEDDPDARVELRVEVNALRGRSTRPENGAKRGNRR